MMVPELRGKTDFGLITDKMWGYGVIAMSLRGKTGFGFVAFKMWRHK